jgi:hypothetical protein
MSNQSSSTEISPTPAATEKDGQQMQEKGVSEPGTKGVMRKDFAFWMIILSLAVSSFLSALDLVSSLSVCSCSHAETHLVLCSFLFFFLRWDECVSCAV